jgi:hypothetical protein
MIIILKNISTTTREQDIEGFMKPAIKGGLLRKSGYIEKISILALKDTRTDKIKYHGLVTVTPDSVADRVIKKLNKKPLNGKRITVCEHKVRRWQNDPRINNKNQIQAFRDKRVGDRRLWHKEVKVTTEKDISSLFSSDESFSKKFNGDTF